MYCYIIIFLILYLLYNNNNESFIDVEPPFSLLTELEFGNIDCKNQCNNLIGCNAYYYEPKSKKCILNDKYDINEIQYHHSNTVDTKYRDFKCQEEGIKKYLNYFNPK